MASYPVPRVAQVTTGRPTAEGAVESASPLDEGTGPSYATEKEGEARGGHGGPPRFAVGAAIGAPKTGGEVGRVTGPDVDDDAHVIARVAPRPVVTVVDAPLPVNGRVPPPVAPPPLSNLVAVEGGTRHAGVDRTEA